MSQAPALELRSATASLSLLPSQGGRAGSLVVNGLELLARDNDGPLGWGWYPMAPWPGRLRDNAVRWDGRSHPMPVVLDGWAMHGRVFDAPWQVLHADAHSAVLGIELGTGPGDPWPWSCQVRSTWTLTHDRLETGLEVRSNGEQFPAELGWHPWFRKDLAAGGPAVLDLPATAMFARGPDYLPTGELLAPGPGPYDDTFELPEGAEVALRWPGALELRCRSDCRYVVVFDERPDSVCVEPQTGPPDWINREPGLVRPGRPRTAHATWSWAAPTYRA